MFEILADLQRGEHKTIIMVEQNAKKGLEFADIGYVLVSGRIAALAGRGRELLGIRRGTPVSRRVARGRSSDAHGDLPDPLLPFARPGLVHRLAVRIDGDGDRHVDDVELVDRLHAEIGERHDTRLANCL